MKAAAANDAGHHAATVAERAEKRWTWVVAAIVVLLVGVMAFTGLHWAAMPPSRVETIDPKTLHIAGEFVEANLGTSIEPDGKVVLRVVAQQYSFAPQCIVVPADTPVTIRATSADAVHGFIVGTTNANVMLVPGFVGTFTTTFRRGELLMPCHEFCGTGHEGMWAHVRVVERDAFAAEASNGKKVTCVPG